MKNLTIRTNNGNVDFVIPELDFTNVACDLEDFGINLMGDLDGKTLSICRATLAIVTGEKDKKKAGLMLTEHLKNGGSLEDILTIFKEAMEDAGFGEVSEENQTEEIETTQETPTAE